MFSALRKHINPASLLALVALVFAATGGAFAATGGGSHPTLTASAAAKKKKSTSGKPGPRGPRGPAGPAGPAGAQGAAGPQGPAGAAGAKGENGAAGSNGTNGKDGTNGGNGASVKVISTTPVGCGATGGIEVELEGSGQRHTLCNGKEGKQGNPAAYPKTLPSGESETGVWEVTTNGQARAGHTDESYAAIAYPLPLPSDLQEEHVKYLSTKSSPTAECDGNFSVPKAEPGYLCLYADSETEPEGTITMFEGVGSEVGQIVRFKGTAGEDTAAGSWAVTAE